VLFADIKGSMELLADRDPEEARQLLDPVLERMMAAVHRYEGTVNQVLGDGIMALFGAPIAHEDHAVRAGYAALQMQEAAGRYAEELRRRQGLDVQIRVGVNSGEVVVRSIASDLHMDYTAVGQTTHLAARMEQLARPGTILLTADTLRLVEGYLEAKPLGPVPVKGMTDPIEVYEVLGAGPVRSRLQAAAARGLTRFVGRQQEMALLRQALERAVAGHGQVVAVIGEPGVGKSRLFYEFTHSHRTHGWLLLESGSVSYAKATPYLPIIGLLKAYCQIEDRDDTRRIHEKLTGKLLTLDRALEPTLPAFLSLLDVPVEDATWQALDPPQGRQRTLEALKRLLLRESLVQPLLLVFEDLHWADAETQAFLDSLLESLPTARILLLVNYRPEYRHGWGSKTYYTQLRLDPLPLKSAAELLHALVGDDSRLQPLKRLLFERTEGNPFFLEESVWTLVETGVLVGQRGAYRLAQAFPSIEVSATVQAVLAARIDRLPPKEKRLLQTAAVIGTEVPFPLLQAIAGQPEEALRHSLARLQAAEFLYEASLFPELEYLFKHALTHEVAYGSLLYERRRTLHARIVEAIEALYPDRLAEQIERLAHHALQGEVWDKALCYCQQAGAKAFARSAHQEVVACFEQALMALGHLPEQRETREQAIDLRLDLYYALSALGEFGPMLDALREAETLAGALADQRRLGQVSAYLSRHFWLMGDQDRALACGQRTLTIAEALGDFALQITANFYFGVSYHAWGDYRQAVACLRKNVAALAGDLRRERFGLPYLPSVSSCTYLAWSLAELGMFPEGIARAAEGIQIAEVAEHPFSLVVAYLGSGRVYLNKGDLRQAISVLEHGISLCQTANIQFLFPWIASALGSAYALSGQLTAALPLLEQAVEQNTAMRLMVYHARWAADLSDAYLLAGRLEDARGMVGRALQLADDHQQRGHQAYALRLVGEMYAQQDPPALEHAEPSYGRALALADELGMRPLVAHCHLGLGTLYARMGRAEKARIELSTAIELYRAMDMTFWLPQAEAALAQVEGR
jgi:class 3 adenylate cyclase/tetratricopeptide (TPR) repeat protein